MIWVLLMALEFDIIVADPPWRYDFSKSSTRKVENHYPTMTQKELLGFLDGFNTAPDAVIFLWATAPKLLQALEVMAAWRFDYITNAVWDKEIIGMGYWFRGQHELILVGKRGKYKPPEPGCRQSSVIRARRGEHSAKPELLQDWIDRAWPDARKLELFACRERPGWTCYGNAVKVDCTKESST